MTLKGAWQGPASSWCQHLIQHSTSCPIKTQSTGLKTSPSPTHFCTFSKICTAYTSCLKLQLHSGTQNHRSLPNHQVCLWSAVSDIKAPMSASSRARGLLRSSPSRAAQWTKCATPQRLPLAAAVSMMGERRWYAVTSGRIRARMNCALDEDRNAKAARVSWRRGYAKSVASDVSNVSETSSSTSESDLSSQSSFGGVEETGSPEFGFAFE